MRPTTMPAIDLEEDRQEREAERDREGPREDLGDGLTGERDAEVALEDPPR